MLWTVVYGNDRNFMSLESEITSFRFIVSWQLKFVVDFDTVNYILYLRLTKITQIIGELRADWLIGW